MFSTNYAVLKLLFWILLGIFSAYFIPFPKIFVFISLLCFILNLVIMLFLKRKPTILKQKWSSALVFFNSFCIGFILTTCQWNHPFSNIDSPEWKEQREYKAQIVDLPQVRERSVKFIVKTLDQLVLLYVAKDSNALQLQYGDQIQFTGRLQQISPPQNPMGFNYRKYMKQRGVELTLYLATGKWEKIGTNQGSWIKRESIKTQQKLTQILQNSSLSKDQFSIAAAILLGFDDTMEPELKTKYSNAGVSHILCVSGLHVGIIFAIVNYLLFPLEYSKRGRLIRTIILFVVIWVYASITGLSPSVMRSATMFSFVLLGKVAVRKTNVFQSLYTSLFFLLTSNPLLIFDLGFQLSYLAVFSIVIFQKPIHSIWSPKTYLGNYFWDLATVSVAAQILTSPISIFYFHQFPNYFLLGNLSVIFLSFCVMVNGIIVLAFSFFPWLFRITSFCLEWLIKAMNWIISQIQSLPGAVSHNLHLSLTETILLYILIFLLYFAILKRKKSLLFAFLTCSLVTIFLYNFDLYEIKNKGGQIILFSTSKSSALLFQNGRHGILLSDSITNEQCAEYQYSIKNYAIANHLRMEFITTKQNHTAPRFFKEGPFIYGGGKTMLVLTDWLPPINNKSKINYILILNPEYPIEKVLDQVDFDCLLLDQSISKKDEKRWIKACKKRNLPVYSVREEGYFHVSLAKNN